ncbi:E3 ubiquitin-protein ligase bre1 [Phytophthora boehmeriae]|uniref:E3 ubiquitin protein ligase n=1 Tax=Phytophthora boehmeriae TaxID=109152 RepID=A0A8T1X846_9STRA|nr:E3 ubiquitin-protein ligase bre1 [Phytophthora boehmeriae]
MADSGAQTRENGVSHKKRREADSSLGGSESASKKIKLEDTTPPEANPNTMEAVREKNRALEIDMKEKNRRIAFLTRTCEALYRSQGMAGASFRCLRRQWFTLQDELLAAVKTVDPSAVSDETSYEAWRTALDAINDFGQVRVRAEELKLNLPEWFLTVARDADTEEPDADVSLPTDEDPASKAFIDAADLTKMEQEVHGQLQQKSEEMKQLLQKLLGIVGSASQDKTKPIEYAHIIQEKRVAVAEALDLKQQLQACKARIMRLERDVEYKETERHQACRDYDRLSSFMKRQGNIEDISANGNDIKSEKDADDEKPREKDTTAIVNQEELTKKEAEHAKAVATLRENMTILSTKLYQERQKMDSMRRELDKLKALEAAWKNDEITLIQEHEEKLKQLQDEKAQAIDEYNKIKHKAKDVEHHMTEKWEKKITKIQAEMSKTKAQIDEVNLKNVSLREKLSNASNYRDQLTEAKSELEAVKRENVTLKAKAEREQSRADRAQASADSEQIQELAHKFTSLEKEKQELQQAYDALKQAEMKNATDKLSDALKRLSELETKRQLELQEHHKCSSDREKLRSKVDDMKASSEAAREENDALLLEIETMSKDLESMRHSRKKYVQQIEEKRNSCKKLHTLLAREEQAKAHCFEELAAARLQVSSLSTVHKHQKAFLESSKECLQAKELELEKMKEYVKTIEAERETADAEKRIALRDAEVAKKIVASSAAESTQRQQQMLQEKQRPCEQCDTFRKKTEEYERQLQSAKSASSTGELTDLERFELRDLQKMVNCSVCQDRRKDVIISKCFHMFCKECIDNNLKSRNRKCPTCKKMFGHDDVKTVWFT